MIKILNNLPDYCENCPYLKTEVRERLCSGAVAFTCENLVFCDNAIRQYRNSKEAVHEED